MDVFILKNEDECSEYAARMITDLVKSKPNAVLGLATGRTPIDTYARMVRIHNEEHVSFKDVKTFNLDEYYGIDESHPSSYHSFMQKHLFSKVDINQENVHVPSSKPQNVAEFCAWYENEIKKAGGIDIQLLGIGGNGHIGFNEPTSSLASRTRIKVLTEKTRTDNTFDFGTIEKVPMHAITMGIGTIMESRQIIIMAFGTKKADIVRQMIEGPVTALVPASVLQMHPSVKVIIDEDAASALERKEYYKWVFDNRPN